jgi:hypothetical protein
MTMKEKELKSAILDIEIPKGMDQRLIEGCKGRQRRPVFNHRRPLLAAAACILAFVMLFGYPYLTKSPGSGNLELKMGESPLVIKVHASSRNGEIIFEDMKPGAKILRGGYPAGISSVPGFPFEFSYPGTTIELAVDNGEFIIHNYVIERLGNTYTINEEGLVYWRPIIHDSNTNELLPGLVEDAVIDYKIIENGHIVGMGIIKISQENFVYSAELILSTGFPKVGGKYQRVTEEDIKRIREEALEGYDAD